MVAKKVVRIALAEMACDRRFVDVPIVEVQVYYTVTSVLCLYSVFVNTWGLQDFAKEGVGVVFANGVIDVGLHGGMNNDGNRDILAGDAVADGTSVCG